MARTYTVFNADQVDRMPPPEIPPVLGEEKRISAAEAFVCSTGANIRHGGDVACYLPHLDQIWMPEFGQLADAQAYYAVLAHECVHWSGAMHRLDRDLTGRFGDESYAMEELVAELGAAFIAARLGISVEPRPDHAAYIQAWLKVFGSDKRALLTAASQAQRATDYLFEFASSADSDRGMNPAIIASNMAASRKDHRTCLTSR